MALREPAAEPYRGTLRGDGEGPFAINDASLMVPCDTSWRAMVAKMRADAEEFRTHWQEPLLRRFYPGLFIVWSHRLAHTLHIRGLRPLAMVVMWLCHALTGTEIRPGALVGPGLMVVHPSGIVIGGGTVIGARLQLYGGNAFGSRPYGAMHGSPRLGDDVVLGAHAMVVGPVMIGDGAEVGAASLVLHDVPPGAKVKGSPAR
jgi:serine O-acetyltransferase